MKGCRIGRLRRRSGSVHVSPWALLRNARFVRALAAQFISQTFDAACTLLLAKVYLFDSAGGPAAGQIISAALTAALPLFVGGPFAAYVVDRFPRRMTLVTGQLVRAVVAVAYLGAELTDAPNLVFPLAAFGLCVGRVLYTARVASVRHLVRQHELVAADSLMLTTGSVAGVSGAAVGALLYLTIGPVGFVAAGLGHLLATALYTFLSTDLGGGNDRIVCSNRRMLAALRRPKIRYAIVTTTAHRAGVGVMIAMTVMHGHTGDGPVEAWYGTVLGAAALGAFLATLTAEWFNEHLKRRAVSTLVFVVAALCSLPSASGLSVPFVLASVLGLGFAFQTLRVCSDATVQKNAPRGTSGRVFSVYDISYNSAYLMGFIVAATLSPVSRPSLIALCVLAWFTAGVVASLLLSRGEDLNTTDMPSGILVRAATPAST